MPLLHDHRWRWQALQLGFINFQHRRPQPHQVTDRRQLDQGNAVCPLPLQLIGQDAPQHIPAKRQIEMPGQHPQASQGFINRPLPAHLGEGSIIVETAIPILQRIGLLLEGDDRARALHPFRIQDDTGLGGIAFQIGIHHHGGGQPQGWPRRWLGKQAPGQLASHSELNWALNFPAWLKPFEVV